jgi:hypothetical protein
MASKLPNEMLHEILLPVLGISDGEFADTDLFSPTISASRSSTLLVCKHWLRVAYPILYSTVIIRSSNQARALAHSLMANKSLGKYVRKLRLEGGYDFARRILLLTPNITDIYLSLFVWSSDGVGGLCSSLSLINPYRVILYDEPVLPRNNASVRRLFAKICECIPSWTNLVLYCSSSRCFP